MDQISEICPQCHVQIRATDYFCYNCGKNLKPKPLPTDITTQILYYAGSLLLPPMGIIWGIRYLREHNNKANIIGTICIIITVIVIIMAIISVVSIMNLVNQQINSQMENIMQF